MTILGKVSAASRRSHIEGATELDGVLAAVESGNEVILWPTLTYDEGKDQTRIAFFLEWRNASTPNDIAEVIAFTDSLMDKTAAFYTETPNGGDPFADERNTEWLRAGTPPKSGRTEA